MLIIGLLVVAVWLIVQYPKGKRGKGWFNVNGIVCILTGLCIALSAYLNNGLFFPDGRWLWLDVILSLGMLGMGISDIIRAGKIRP